MVLGLHVGCNRQTIQSDDAAVPAELTQKPLLMYHALVFRCSHAFVSNVYQTTKPLFLCEVLLIQLGRISACDSTMIQSDFIKNVSSIFFAIVTLFSHF